MYNPQKYKSSDQNEVFDLMDRNPFATVITVVEGKPFISHLPLTPIKIGGGFELKGHLARANPHWKFLAKSQVTVIFHGPHTYITPEWYAVNDVPTWNYTTVHLTGTVELIESKDGLVECLKELTSQVERHWSSGWEFFIPGDLEDDALVKAIVGFRITVNELSFKKKLSQNRSPEDRTGVLKGLATRNDDNSRAILSEMKKLSDSE